MTQSSRPPRGGTRRPQAARTSVKAQGSTGGRTRRKAVPPQGDFATPESVIPPLPAVSAFDELDMPAALLKTLTAQGVTEPFPIQGATLPNSIAGRDLLGRGRTGSGKTLAFGLALLTRTAGLRAEPKAPLALVLVPTRELAQQVTDALTPYATAVNLRLATVVGGLSLTRQAATLRRGAEVLVATPGRLKDLIERGDVALGEVRISVLDEADQMADMGFLPQVTALLKQVAPGGQTMLFSATLDRNVDRLVRQFLTDPVVHSVDPSQGAVTTMVHHVLHVIDETDKKAVATRIAARENRVIMFVDTKRGADRFAKRLLASGVRAAALHGGRSQPQRNRTLDQFKNGQVTALIATNVAARGIHIDDLDLVVNVDPPMDHKDYLHRGGRTARAGESGSVVTLVLPDEKREMTKLMSDAGITPHTARVKSGDEELVRITGAREPSGVPVVLEVPQQAVAEPKASGGRRRRSSSAGASASGASAAAGRPRRGEAAGSAGGTGRTGSTRAGGRGQGQGSAAAAAGAGRRPQGEGRGRGPASGGTGANAGTGAGSPGRRRGRGSRGGGRAAA
ncbi:DEAD/DEAH box helicase [Streptomyces sp. NPDC060194]|uniref:DEAD/DEAH box helicase n=1 Tax=Streptomyces sp. NPDC060194 TaxID=3347069 RepID=UPI00365588CB